MGQINDGSIQTQSNSDADNLVNEVFITGTCKNVSNISSSGALESFGVFQNAATILGFPEGIILSTGNARSAEGPNGSVETTTQFGNMSVDRDLVDIATDQLFDVTVLEFDFVPVETEVTFQYVFASEEYCEFVGTNFNDVFGFFVSGPGINGPFSDGAINVARLPDSDEFVSINTVNHSINRNSYVKNEMRDDIDNCNITFDPKHLFTIEFDGFTIPLLARFSVIPCETYHIRLVVGDVGDDKLDSAVFLRANSFDLGEVATVEAKVPNQTEAVAFENCLDGQFIFSRPKGSFNFTPLTIGFEIDALSTALEGVDFSNIPRSVTIPAGQNTVALDIPTLLDGQAETLERLIIKLNLSQACECKEGDSATLHIMDPDTPQLILPPRLVCAGQAFSIAPDITGGVPPYTFTWNGNSEDMSLQTTIQTETTFSLTVTDVCNQQAMESVTIKIQNEPSAELSGVIDYCNDVTDVTLPVNFNGQPPWSFTYQINNSALITIDSIFDENFNLPVSQSGNYQLIEFSDASCDGKAIGMGLVNDINIKLDVDIRSPSCPDANDGQIKLTIQGDPPYDINWTPPLNDDTNPTNVSAGVYSLNIRDARNCLVVESIVIDNPSDITVECLKDLVYIPNAFSPNGDGSNDFFEIYPISQTLFQQGLKVEIFDRWGNLVYLSEEALPKWDGRVEGELLSPAVFMYVISIELNAEKTEYLKGSLHLIR